MNDNTDKFVINQYSFCELIKHLLVYYTDISYANASKIVDGSHLSKPISNITEASLLGHEYAYYWAMNLYYGHMYWQKGIPAQPNNLSAYFELEDSIIKQYNLKESLIEQL